MQPLSNQQLAIKANEARILGLTMVHDAASGHPGGSMSCLDLVTALYFNVMHVDTQNPQDPDRDRFVMSKGHCSPALYPVLALRGFFPEWEAGLDRPLDASTARLWSSLAGRGITADGTATRREWIRRIAMTNF